MEPPPKYLINMMEGKQNILKLAITVMMINNSYLARKSEDNRMEYNYSIFRYFSRKRKTNLKQRLESCP